MLTIVIALCNNSVNNKLRDVRLGLMAKIVGLGLEAHGLGHGLAARGLGLATQGFGLGLELEILTLL